jgi:hypothetical protein
MQPRRPLLAVEHDLLECFAKAQATQLARWPGCHHPVGVGGLISAEAISRNRLLPHAQIFFETPKI